MGLLIFYITLPRRILHVLHPRSRGAFNASNPRQHSEERRKRTAAMWAHLKDDDSVRPLTAILTLNTIAHTMGAAGVGSQVQQYGALRS